MYINEYAYKMYMHTHSWRHRHRQPPSQPYLHTHIACIVELFPYFLVYYFLVCFFFLIPDATQVCKLLNSGS